MRLSSNNQITISFIHKLFPSAPVLLCQFHFVDILFLMLVKLKRNKVPDSLSNNKVTN